MHWPNSFSTTIQLCTPVWMNSLTSKRLHKNDSLNEFADDVWFDTSWLYAMLSRLFKCDTDFGVRILFLDDFLSL